MLTKDDLKTFPCLALARRGIKHAPAEKKGKKFMKTCRSSAMLTEKMMMEVMMSEPPRSGE